jgi:hypothetical protein
MTVEYLNTLTYLDIPADRVLEAAVGKLKTAVVIGYDKDDSVYIASSTGNKATIHYLAALAQKATLED